jgi:hypothetical protein
LPICWLGVCIILKAQGNIWDSPQAYLGQTLPVNEPVKFAPQLINDSPYFSMDRIAFSPNEKEFYHCRNNDWFSPKGITNWVFILDESYILSYCIPFDLFINSRSQIIVDGVRLMIVITDF